MKDANTIHAADLVRLSKQRTAIENELMADTIATWIAFCVGSSVVLVLIWLA